MKLSASVLNNIVSGKVIIPSQELLQLPEKVVQFGTGILLRGLPDFLIDKANRAGIFNGRIVVVKTTSKGDTTAFDEQNGLYTLCIRGIENNKKVEENIINSSISRVLNAQHEWAQILQCARNPDLQIIISNTTEVGIQLVKDDIHLDSPISYPGKLLALLFERFIAFKGNEKSGLVIIPTELIPGNGDKLASIIIELAQMNNLSTDFIEWMKRYNHFCNSLVDRIVTGMPDREVRDRIENELGYTDELLNVCEVYRLWAIQGDNEIKKILSFAEADEGTVIAPDIDLFRELKLRLLNGTHTLSCGIAFFAGLDTVKNAMDDTTFENYISDLMQNEIGISIPYEIDPAAIKAFSGKVLDRFRNPFINHYWKNITLNYSSKMKLRCIPLLVKYYEKMNSVPELFALGFAAYIYFMKAVKQAGKEFYGEYKGELYIINDEMAENFYKLWQNVSVDAIVKEVLQNVNLWEKDLTFFTGFEQSVAGQLNSIIKYGMKETIENAIKK